MHKYMYAMFHIVSFGRHYSHIMVLSGMIALSGAEMLAPARYSPESMFRLTELLAFSGRSATLIPY